MIIRFDMEAESVKTGDREPMEISVDTAAHTVRVDCDVTDGYLIRNPNDLVLASELISKIICEYISTAWDRRAKK